MKVLQTWDNDWKASDRASTSELQSTDHLQPQTGHSNVFVFKQSCVKWNPVSLVQYFCQYGKIKKASVIKAFSEGDRS